MNFCFFLKPDRKRDAEIRNVQSKMQRGASKRTVLDSERDIIKISK